MDCKVYYRDIDKNLHMFQVGNTETVSLALSSVAEHLKEFNLEWKPPMLALIQGNR